MEFSTKLRVWLYTNINVLFCYIMHFICDPVLWEHVPRSVVTPRLWEWCDNTFSGRWSTCLPRFPFSREGTTRPATTDGSYQDYQPGCPSSQTESPLGAQNNALAWKLDHLNVAAEYKLVRVQRVAATSRLRLVSAPQPVWASWIAIDQDIIETLAGRYSKSTRILYLTSFLYLSRVNSVC